MIRHKRTKWLIAGTGLTITLAVIGYQLLSESRYNVMPRLISNFTTSPSDAPFPTIDTSELSEAQQRIVSIMQQEYRSQPDGTKYSDGEKQAWCANFVSWVYRETDLPFTNPHSGSWRIPGVYTLREYLESADKFQPATAEYRPKTGDILIYDNPSRFGQHTNLVLINNNGTITTIGGNEHGKIRVTEDVRPLNDPGFVGYGVL